MALSYVWIVLIIWCAILSMPTYVSCQPASSDWFQHPKLTDSNTSSGGGDNAASVTVDKAYIIRLDSTTANVTSAVQKLMDMSVQDGGQVRYVYKHAFPGFSVIGMSNERMKEILDDSVVVVASRVAKVRSNSLRTRAGARAAPPMKKQTAAIWNLDELTSPFEDDEYHYTYDGTGVRVYILDTGLDIKNTEFGTRAKCGWDAYGTNCVDVQGHGSHVGGTVGGTTWGVAKNAFLTGVKVLDDEGSGAYDIVIAGIEWVMSRKRRWRSVPMVINMSLGGPKYQLVNDAVRSAVRLGITVVVSAGNEYGADSCLNSPASSPDAITVGATTSSNWPAMFTNGGPCVDIMAPGDSIESINVCGPTDWFCWGDSVNLSGTSMSSPHVAGVAALHLQKNRRLKPAQVWQAIKSDARTNVVDDVWNYNVPDLLLSVNQLLL